MSDQKLKKNLKLFDVYAISTGAMFSSGFFLLPGIAAAYTGPSVYLAYLVAGFLIIPAMLCMAELTTAMPKAGGTYYFLDRALGPMAGTIGGLGSWIAVIFKSAFALVGMGAYLSLYIDVPITALAIILTIVFGLINVFGAKETTLLQRILVSTLVVILAAFVIKGLIVVGVPEAFYPKGTYGDFFKSGFMGFMAVIGLVFVSYAGLTKVASVAEEVENPDRNIPLGMFLSLITATAVYTLGMMVMVNVLDPSELYSSLTPVADAGAKFLGWMPYDMGVILIVVSAIAAFASTGNAGIMSASRYPFAMAKDSLLPKGFSKLGKFKTPTTAIVVTVVAMMAVLVLFDVESVAKLASAFQLLLFGLVCVAVIVMRESQIETYRPGFKSPLYPWMQIIGVLISFWLILEMGILAIGFTGMLVIACAFWYFFYAFGKIERDGALLHVHARLGKNQYEGLERELMTIIHERTTDENLTYEGLIARSLIFDFDEGAYSADKLMKIIAGAAQERTSLTPEQLENAFDETLSGKHIITPHTALWYKTFDDLDTPELMILRFHGDALVDPLKEDDLKSLMFLFAPKTPAGLDLRLAGHIAEVAQSDDFKARWMDATEHRELREILMRDDHFLHQKIEDIPYLHGFIGSEIKDIKMPGTCLIAMMERDGDVVIAHPNETLKAGDELAIIGESKDLKHLLDKK